MCVCESILTTCSTGCMQTLQEELPATDMYKRNVALGLLYKVNVTANLVALFTV